MSSSTLVQYYQYLRDICSWKWCATPIQLGGLVKFKLTNLYSSGLSTIEAIMSGKTNNGCLELRMSQRRWGTSSLRTKWMWQRYLLSFRVWWRPSLWLFRTNGEHIRLSRILKTTIHTIQLITARTFVNLVTGRDTQYVESYRTWVKKSFQQITVPRILRPATQKNLCGANSMTAPFKRPFSELPIPIKEYDVDVNAEYIILLHHRKDHLPQLREEYYLLI